MDGWNKLTGALVSLPIANIDTDQIIPARFMSAPRTEGYAKYLFYDMRRQQAGDLAPIFPLNLKRSAEVLVSGENFGTGSSREAAVYALVDAGFQAVLAPSFGDIFAANAINNGLLPAILDQKNIDRIAAHESSPIEIDLETRLITHAGESYPFELDESWRTKLINGWDDIDVTHSFAPAIESFKRRHFKGASWRHAEKSL